MLKTTDQPYTAKTVNTDKGTVSEVAIEPAGNDGDVELADAAFGEIGAELALRCNAAREQQQARCGLV